MISSVLQAFISFVLVGAFTELVFKKISVKPSYLVVFDYPQAFAWI